MDVDRKTEFDLSEAKLWLAYFTECHLATLEGAEMRKAMPKGELKRLSGLADSMVLACKQLGIEVPPRGPGGEFRARTHRLRERLGATP